MKVLFLAPLFLVFIVPVSFAQSETIFSGMPTLKISEGGIERSPEKLARKDAANLKCVISKIGAKYWPAEKTRRSFGRKVGLSQPSLQSMAPDMCGLSSQR
jgi:hypothetical protein